MLSRVLELCLKVVTIGIDDYDHWPDLEHAVADADAVEQLLISDFKAERIARLRAPKRRDDDELAPACDVIKDLFANGLEDIEQGDNLFFYFAGHGDIIDDQGFLIPMEADEPTKQQCINIEEDIIGPCRNLQNARSVFLVFDTCHSGMTFKDTWSDQSKGPCIQALVAGKAGQFVLDGEGQGHSLFAQAVLDGLRGYADIGLHGEITGSELIAYVKAEVSKKSRGREVGFPQDPQGGYLQANRGGEEFRFVPTGPRLPKHILEDLRSSNENQIISAVKELADLTVVSIDPSGTHGTISRIPGTEALFRAKTLLDLLEANWVWPRVAESVGIALEKCLLAAPSSKDRQDIINRLSEIVLDSDHPHLWVRVGAARAVPYPDDPEKLSAFISMLGSNLEGDVEWVLRLHEQIARRLRYRNLGNRCLDEVSRIIRCSRELYTMFVPSTVLYPFFEKATRILDDLVPGDESIDSISDSSMIDGVGGSGMRNLVRTLLLGKILVELLERGQDRDHALDLLIRVLEDRQNVHDWVRAQAFRSLWLWDHPWSPSDDKDCVGRLTKILLSFERVTRDAKAKSTELNFPYFHQLSEYYQKEVGESTKTLTLLLAFYYLEEDPEGSKWSRAVADLLVRVLENRARGEVSQEDRVVAAQGLRSLASGISIAASLLPMSNEDDPYYDDLRPVVIDLLKWIMQSAETAARDEKDGEILAHLGETVTDCREGLAWLEGTVE